MAGHGFCTVGLLDSLLRNRPDVLPFSGGMLDSGSIIQVAGRQGAVHAAGAA
jgi:hypothetical protein